MQSPLRNIFERNESIMLFEGSRRSHFRFFLPDMVIKSTNGVEIFQDVVFWRSKLRPLKRRAIRCVSVKVVSVILLRRHLLTPVGTGVQFLKDMIEK